MRVVLVAGATRTAGIEGISAAGADPALVAHTPSADAEILVYGRPVYAPVVPVSPTGCPTPAVVSRAVRELLGFETLVVDAGLARETAAPVRSIGAAVGGDVREPDSVSDAADVHGRARRLGRALPDEELVVGETIPGGTTTALGVLRALGVDAGVSSSFPENPIALKERVVEAGLDASELDPGDAAGAPLVAVERMGDPVLAAVSGLVEGAAESGTAVTLAGGSQMIAAGALVRHAGVDVPLRLATTSFVRDDPSLDIDRAAGALDLNLVVTNPAFDAGDGVVFERFCAGEAKEGVCMGATLSLADAAGFSLATVRERISAVYDRLLSTTPVTADAAASMDSMASMDSADAAGSSRFERPEPVDPTEPVDPFDPTRSER